MNPRLRAGVAGGIFGGLMALISGAHTAYVAGMISGMIAGLVASQLEHLDRPVDGMRQGIQAGLVAGALLLLGALLRGLLIDPALGLNRPLGTIVMMGLGGLVVAGVTAALFGVVRALRAPNDRIGTFLLLGAIVLLYPWLDRLFLLGYMNEVIPIMVFVLMALGLNIVVGYAGLLDLGYAAFFAIGAYTTGMISSPASPFGINMSFWLAIWIAAAVAAIFGVILGAPTLPLRGDYLAIVTLGFGEIVPIAANNLDKFSINILGSPILTDFDLTGGPKGINPINRPNLPFIGDFRPDQPIPWYYLILAIMVFSVFFILRLRDSRLGRAWMAMREDELAAASMGIDIVNTKLTAFAMGATFSGFAGAFYGAYISAIFPSSFRFDVSVMLLCMVILGGLGNMTGVVLGGLIIQFADRLFLPQLSQLIQNLLRNVDNPALRELNFASDFRLLLFGLTLVIMMLVRPEGLVPSERRRMELHAGEEPEAELVSPSENQELATGG
ncbi:MAG TPA: branched-chain amino acid ABC transporter permease [Roseiflexaceae bacterium]|nr:branched-chain amino acid ABC transporter permease [Roseiflexaceae bacterium]